jgi:hypothetical protein
MIAKSFNAIDYGEKIVNKRLTRQQAVVTRASLPVNPPMISDPWEGVFRVSPKPEHIYRLVPLGLSAGMLKPVENAIVSLAYAASSTKA